MNLYNLQFIAENVSSIIFQRPELEFTICSYTQITDKGLFLSKYLMLNYLYV